MIFIHNQDDYIILNDSKSNGKENPWRIKKINSLLLSESYKRLHLTKKSFRVKKCGDILSFKKYDDGNFKLHQANFCKVRLCPMCAWRRSLKIFGQVSKIMDRAVQQEEFEYLFLTLTIKNCTSAELNNNITKLMSAFKELNRTNEFKNIVKGYFRALEVTHNINSNSKSYDTYHPHFHCILVVNKSYFNSRDYLTQLKWTSIWQKCLKVDYVPIVHITKFKSSDEKQLKKSIAETAKYSVKDSDFIIKLDENLNNQLPEETLNQLNLEVEKLTDDSVKTLDSALANRRLTAFGGILKQYHKELNLDDIEDGDLINTDNEEIRDDLKYMIVRYSWNIGLKNYIQM